jgi:hypothetical protein
MRKIRFALIIAIIVTAFPGVVWAAPTVVSSFTISPSTAYPGNTVTFQVNFTVAPADVLTRNTFCFYYQDGSYDATFAALGAITSNLGDSYDASVQATAGSASAHCAGLPGYKILEYSAPAADQFSDGGDQLLFSFSVPVGATTQTFRLRQYNAIPTLMGVFNSTLTIQVLGNQIYVANDATSCGSNSPCLTGPAALNTALDNVTGPGDVFVLGDYLVAPNSTADLTTAKSVTISGVGGASINMAAGVCAGTAIVNNGGTLVIQNLAMDGTCATGNRAAAIRNEAGTLTVRNVTVRDFAGSGIGIAAAGGTTTVEGSHFSNNNVALDGNGGVLYAFANNINSNTSLNAAANIDASDNVKCNYWNSYNVSGTGAAQYEQRLGAPVSTYIEGTGALALGRASLAAGTGSRVIVNMGRGTPPFNNGTVLGLGAQTSDFFAFCLARDGSALGAITVTSDPVAAGTNGHRLYKVTNTAECSPSTNTACWDLAGTVPSSAVSASGAISAVLSPQSGYEQEGHYVIGNQVDPTAIAISSFTTNSSAQASGAWLALIAAASLLAGVWLWQRRRSPLG